MENLISIASDINELVTTIQEGLKHIQTRTEEGCFDDTLYLFEDIVQGLNSIMEALQTMVSSQKTSRNQDKTIILLDVLDEIYLAYQNKTEGAGWLLNEKLLPAFAEWKAELETYLLPIIQS